MHFYLEFFCFFRCEKKSSATSIYLSITISDSGIKSEIYLASCDKFQISLKSNCSIVRSPQNIFQDFLNWKTHVTQMRIHYFSIFAMYSCSMFNHFSSICTHKFQAFVSVNFLLQIFWVWTICNPVILRSTSEAHIWNPAVAFCTLILKYLLIEG